MCWSAATGGDVKSARAAVLAQPYTDAPPEGHHIHRVFQAEYSTVVLVSGLSELLPVVALCDGIWMGLGFGIAGYCRHRWACMCCVTMLRACVHSARAWGFCHVGGLPYERDECFPRHCTDRGENLHVGCLVLSCWATFLLKRLG